MYKPRDAEQVVGDFFIYLGIVLCILNAVGVVYLLLSRPEPISTDNSLLEMYSTCIYDELVVHGVDGETAILRCDSLLPSSIQ